MKSPLNTTNLGNWFTFKSKYRGNQAMQHVFIVMFGYQLYGHQSGVNSICLFGVHHIRNLHIMCIHILVYLVSKISASKLGHKWLIDMALIKLL